MVTEICDRCGGRPPLETRFWVVKSGRVLCETCNVQWAMLQVYWFDAVHCWRGDVLVQAKRTLLSMERRLRVLQQAQGELADA